MESRAVGRPRRGEQEVGAARIIERARKALRQRYFDVSSRKTIAERCFVTPALITYYFPEREDLLLGILEPVLDMQIEQIRRIVNREADATLEDLIECVVSILKDNHNILRSFEFLTASGIIASDKDYIRLIIAEIHSFLRRNRTVAIQYPFCERSFHGAIWGMCKLRADIEIASEAEKDCFTVVPMLQSSESGHATALT